MEKSTIILIICLFIVLLFGQDLFSTVGHSVYEKRLEYMTRLALPLYRIYNYDTGKYLYTQRTAEKNNFIQKGYEYQGILGYIYISNHTNTDPFYKLYNEQNDDYLYTTDEIEKDNAIQNGYNEEIIGNIYPSTYKPEFLRNLVPLYKLYNPQNNNYFYTTDKIEKNDFIQKGYEDLGKIGYILGKEIPCTSDINCPQGFKCENKFCIPEAIIEDCIDTDGGIDYYTAGEVLYIDGKTRKDQCTKDDFIIEWLCDSKGVYGVASYKCPYGCQDGACIKKPGKDMEKYSSKEIFLISDKNWKDVLPLVPVTTWTGDEDCQKGYGTPDNVCVYPTLIYHEEDFGFDADSIIYFIQQYAPDKITIIGQTPQELDNLLITEPELGAGLQENQIQRIFSNDYLSYWGSFKDVVYVEDDYELALLASTYASLINAPLIIAGGNLDVSTIGKGFYPEKNIICIGSVDPIGNSCNEQYNLEQLQQKYVDETNTDKIILVNSNDLVTSIDTPFIPEKSSGEIKKIYTKTSLSAPILAAAKHEIILTTINSDKDNVDNSIESFLAKYPEILSNSFVMPTEINCNSQSLAQQVNYLNILTRELNKLPATCNIDGIQNVDSNYILFPHYPRNNVLYDITSDKFINLGEDQAKEYIAPVFAKINNQKIAYEDHRFKAYGGVQHRGLYLYDLITNTEILITELNLLESTNSLDFDSNYIVRVTRTTVPIGDRVVLHNTMSKTQEIISDQGDNKVIINAKIDGDYVVWKYFDSSTTEEGVIIYNILTKQKLALTTVGYEWDLSDGRIVYSKNQQIFVYDIKTGSENLIDSGENPKILSNKIVFNKDLGNEIWYVLCDLGLNGQKGGCLPSDTKTQIVKKSSIILDHNSIEVSDDYVVWIEGIHAPYTIRGYLTILASPNSIPNKERIIDTRSDSLDQTFYADLNDDFYPDMASGRITGLSSSDISTNIARSLFYKYKKFDNILFTASSRQPYIDSAQVWESIFDSLGYSAISSTSIQNAFSFDPNLYLNKDTIYYLDHGSSNWAGIPLFPNSPNAPEKLHNSFMISLACLTCSNSDLTSFCYNALRRGAVAHIGAVSQSPSINPSTIKIFNGVYHENLTIGQALVKRYGADNTYMITLTGDPTLKIYTPYLLDRPLEEEFNYV